MYYTISMKKYERKKIERIVKLLDKGYTYEAIGKDLGMTKQGVYYLIKKYKLKEVE